MYWVVLKMYIILTNNTLERGRERGGRGGAGVEGGREGGREGRGGGGEPYASKQLIMSIITYIYVTDHMSILHHI